MFPTFSIIFLFCNSISLGLSEVSTSNSNHNNYNHNNKYNGYYNDTITHDMLPAAGAPIYLNEFAVYIPNGHESASSIAQKHGYTNLGQIGSLKNYFLFHHNHVKKRSLSESAQHVSILAEEPEVLWFQQQHVKVRVKRDFTIPGGEDFTRTKRQYIKTPTQGAVFPDPLFKEQWYLNGGAKDGLDMNVGPAYRKGYTGKGVVVTILDDGIQRNHPDLYQNYDPTASYDINGNDSDPMPRDNGDNKHGTRCAGEIAAVAFNNFCGIGIAYNASIGGVRMLDGTVNDAVEAKALGLNPDHIDIYSASWGPEDDGSTVDGPGPLARRAFIFGVTSGREGKGSIFIWASGNGGRYTDSCNCDGYTNSIFTLSISSATQGGYKPWYLEECSSTLASTYSSGTPGHDKSIATVDMDGLLRPDRICTVEHTGTSASAPLAAGICALALEANPSLTWRDMQFLVVLTSRAEPLERETGWIINGVKRKVSHKFGYGLMDAGAMVDLAEKWITVPAQHICKSREINEDRPIESQIGYTFQVHMDVNGCSGTVNEVRFLEHVQCKITLRFFPRGNLRILLTSPMGTTSTLLFERPRDVVKTNFDDWPFLSVHFWGERAEGRWTLQIINGGRRRVNQPGILSKWQLIFYGTQTDPIRLKSDKQPQHGFYGSQTTNIYSDFPKPEDAQFSNVYYNHDNLNEFTNFPDVYVGAGSNPVPSIVNAYDAANQKHFMDDSNNKLVLFHDCDIECDNQGCFGKGPTQCVSCKHYRLDNTCVKKCPPRSYPNQGSVCWPCHESCETCAGGGQDSCLSCAPAHLYVVDLAVCLQVCPDGYYEDYDNKTCIPCASNCASCQDRPDVCSSCEHHLMFYLGRCYPACPKGTFETQDFRCDACHSTCETCNGSSETQCISCKPGLFNLHGKCYRKCPDSYYGDKKRRECLECAANCKSCDTRTCNLCIDGHSLTANGFCVSNASSVCDESEYFEHGQCRSCHSTCASCKGPSETDCLTCSPELLLQNNKCVSSCDDGFFLEDKQCTRCLHTCQQCVSRNNCTSCVRGLQLQSGQCIGACEDGYFSDHDSCVRCYLSCATCSGPRRDQCVKCPKDWQLVNGECHPECPEGFYKSKYGCQKCHHYCKTCDGAGPLSCSSCPSHFMLDGGLCMECTGMQYFDSPSLTCKNCHDTCKTCSGLGQYSCLTCAFPLHLDRLNSQCVPCCANAILPEDQSCCICDKDTGSCINAAPAGKRRIPGPENLVRQKAELKDDSYYLISIDGTHAMIITVVTSIFAIICIITIIIFFSYQRPGLQTRQNLRYQRLKTFDRRKEYSGAHSSSGGSASNSSRSSRSRHNKQDDQNKEECSFVGGHDDSDAVATHDFNDLDDWSDEETQFVSQSVA